MQVIGALSKTLTNPEPEALFQRDLDWRVVQKIQKGQVGVFDGLVQKYRAPIFSVIYNMTSNREDASDLTQAIARFDSILLNLFLANILYDL